MQYRLMGQTGDEISALGYGCMRFPRSGLRIDEGRTERQVLSAIDRGVNYFDTAYIYPGSEGALGRILTPARRGKVFLATKLPPAMVSSRRDMERLLDAQLGRLKAECIDYYLMHALTDMSSWERLKNLGVEEFLEKAKEAGKIRRVAFSFHGTTRSFKQILDDYPWDMAQIQYNYLDEHTQAGREGLDYAFQKGVGVVVMEPLRGGSLAARLPKEVYDIFDAMPIRRSPAEWALRWIWDHPGVTCVLSGMNDEQHIDENIRAAETALPHSLSEEERALFERVREIIGAAIKVPCTGCGYCVPCPAGVNIPMCFSLYNDRHLHKRAKRPSYLVATAGIDGGKPSYASLCTSCGACEKKCPQGIPIRAHLKEAARELEGFYFRPLTGAVRQYYRLRTKKKGGARPQ
ncbi:MAG TPA: aldo/keto reductase [Papillibacter sp.]|nr:aldo/keto reductase [Papillibacter sp.]